MTPTVRPESIMPRRYDHDSLHGPFFTNITGFYRGAKAHTVSLVSPDSQASSFFHDVRIPNANSSTTAYNETLAEELKGSWDWASTAKVDFNLKERTIADFDGHANASFHGWTWVRGGITLYQPDTTDSVSPPTEQESGQESADGGQSIEYEVYGLHHVRNGSYRLFGMPDGKRVDIRRIPTLFEGVEEHDLAREVVLLELEKDVKKQEENLLLADAKPDCQYPIVCQQEDNIDALQ